MDSGLNSKPIRYVDGIFMSIIENIQICFPVFRQQSVKRRFTGAKD